ncbi:hypothetical protein cyc_07491 [Cyclospora cayetanensis]|uniref:Uncharacterized protein n=1 Tax=Cyclospora cayetanensis TaxID=88456 RepID=A0A1D3D4Q0_9EIME|nr:hypothetical protein cyc_07491 [Cyclospora cayetanensis]
MPIYGPSSLVAKTCTVQAFSGGCELGTKGDANFRSHLQRLKSENERLKALAEALEDRNSQLIKAHAQQQLQQQAQQQAQQRQAQDKDDGVLAAAAKRAAAAYKQLQEAHESTRREAAHLLQQRQHRLHREL